MTKESKLVIEAVHMMRKHVIKPRHHGKAVTYKCLECGMNGADTVDDIAHEASCRYAAMVQSVGGSVRFKSKAVQAPDLDACTS